MASEDKKQEYRVLARKYRPQNFAELIGQDALVRTLKNAITTGRIAHAFMLTGVRGVGKTTTARIIAKALNYKGPDGKAQATTEDTSDCKLCQAIAEDRHPDVIEMDAASRTGVDDIREILDGVRYAPTEARYKVYIIDEVHMLSKQAFNALLKTLEEPPPHVKFIFATTEIRKVPITVLSRCQRFDLRRVDVPTLAQHFAGICEKENVKAQPEALDLIARAADGSVRDGLSILDQAISISNGDITADHVQNMLGLADRAASLDMLQSALSGDTQEALAILENYYNAGADPQIILQDLLELTHLLIRLRAVPETQQSLTGTLSPDMITRASEISQSLSIPSLSKSWQLLLKGLQEVQHAPNPQIAAEVILIRLSYAANLPDPKDLIESIKKNSSVNAGATQPLATASTSTSVSTPSAVTSSVQPAQAPPAPRPSSAPPPARTPDPVTAISAAPALHIQPMEAIDITSIHSILRLLEHANEVVLASALSFYAEPIKVTDGTLELGLRDGAGHRIKTLAPTLKTITGKRWAVSFVAANGTPTAHEQIQAREEEERNNILQIPVIKNILSTFDGAELTAITKTPDFKGSEQITRNNKD